MKQEGMCGGKAESGVKPDGPSQLFRPLGEPVSSQSSLTKALTNFGKLGGKAAASKN